MSLSPEFVLLGLLYDHPMHGYELHQTLQREFGQVWHISQSQAYNIINRLLDRGLLRAEVQPREGIPDKHLLFITETGRSRFLTWLSTPTPSATQPIRTEFITRLAFTRSAFPHLEEQIVTEQAALLRTRLQQLDDQLQNLPDDSNANRLALELRIRSLINISTWLEEISAKTIHKE
jgi:DNA-binding PadR family transcriptional regulator